MRLRILVFEDENFIRKALCTFLRGKGCEVLDYPTPATCALVTGQCSACPRNRACADLIITDMNMPEMTGLELVRVMAERGCHAPAQNKIVISSSLTPEQAAEFAALGCHFLPKPFELDELWQLVRSCAEQIPPDRELAPLAELLQTAARQP